ncbi:MAG TPA: hypothetical protein DD381_03260 [Lentisphaeria bacterium]|nr:MAG: hypothetical protein A2X47_02990 [Lentisphaerae bacterium GWF2_38_69]HBM15351.1 hypothetical protein [Lentisphaeria bacterium]
MEEVKPKTSFASPESSEMKEIQEESKLFSDNSLFESFSDSTPCVFIILNENRQIVFTNNRMVELLGVKNKECLIGKMFGEALNCAYSDANEAGCGTSEFCSKCGALKTIMAAMNVVSNVGECSILTKNNVVINLRVWTTSFNIEDKKFVAFSALEIGSEKMERTLQRTFLHDIANITAGISSLTELLLRLGNTHLRFEYTKTLQEATKKLIVEIQAQSELNKILHGVFNLSVSEFSSVILLKNIIATHKILEIARDKPIVIASSAANINMTTDQNLLLRVIGNMTKNALEASNAGEEVKLNCIEYLDSVIFSVSNKKHMPKEVQLQIFKRSFSTKNADRGFGSYIMKAIGENFLKGSVYFESDGTNGTTFYIKIPKVINPAENN